jgi:hypothetical protein
MKEQRHYTIMNPLSAQPILIHCEAERLPFFLSYFRQLMGIWDLPVIEEMPDGTRKEVTHVR